MIYILDTGVRITHGDFGGRAKAGWSAGCPTGSESECGDAERGWLFEGVVTADKSQCNGHGTHCASTAGGSDYGVAECTTIVTVQVLSCAEAREAPPASSPASSGRSPTPRRVDRAALRFPQ